MSENSEKLGKVTLPIMISGITGGEIISERNVGDEINIDDITDTYNRYPGGGAAIDKSAFAAFIKGFTEDLDVKRLLELIKCEVWKKEFGYAVILKEGDNIQALHPKTYQQGFTVNEIDDYGNATIIQMQWKPDEKADPVPTYYDKAINGKDGFYWFRSFRGLLGLRGLSHLLTLVDPLRVQNALFLQYMKHGEWQAINHPVAKIKDLNDTIYNRVKKDLQSPDQDKAVIIDAEDDFYYDGPMAGGSSWDPTAMLEYGDKIISRETGLLLSMLTGDPMGYLSASDTTTAQWFDAVKQYQALILPDYIPLLKALGLTDKVAFNSPYEPTLESKFASIKIAREALEGIVPIEELINVINSIMGFTDDEKLTPDPEYEKRKEMEMENAQNPQSGREDNGSVDEGSS
jgi:hypothetical protein